MTDRHIICDLHIEQERIWDCIEDRLREWVSLHIDELVSDAMIGFEKDLEYIVDGAFKRAENNFEKKLHYTMEELEIALKETKDE